MKHFAILISPSGEEFYCAYGPLTKDRTRATQYVNREIAQKAIQTGLGFGDAFWNSERQARDHVLKERCGWSGRVEPVKPTCYLEVVPS